MKSLIEILKTAGIKEVKENEMMANHTTIKIGGPADIFIEPASIKELEKTMEILKANEVPWTAIGRGSNLLVSDEGMKGAVIKIGKGINHLEIEDDRIRVGAGYSLVALATLISRKGLGGLEFAGGIPGSVGGAVYMNAGAHGSDLSQILIKTRVLFPTGELVWLDVEEMHYQYRTSVLQNERPGIVTEAILQLKKGDKSQIVNAMQKNKDYRMSTQPYNHPCSGSIFRNPFPNYAGRLIEESGLKGYRIGGAEVSELHGNFIINAGDARAADVLALIKHIQTTIKETYGLDLQTEVEIMGRFS